MSSRQLAAQAASPLPPSRLAAISFLGMVLLQGVHEIEHITQVFQRFVFDNPKGAGILGTWLDIEPVHLAYNSAFLLLIALSFWLGHFRTRSLPFWLMSFALLFQGYHATEHVFKILQFLETAMNGTPGILGHFFNLVWLHFTYNTIVYIPILLAFFLGGFHRGAISILTSTSRLIGPALRRA